LKEEKWIMIILDSINTAIAMTTTINLKY